MKDPVDPGFTMAEILLSLTIIGVVAAITLPSLTGNINERTWNTQRKALYSRLSQAMSLMPSLNGYGTVIEGDESTSAVDTAAETFITNGLSKVLKINNVCDSEHLADCGIPDKVVNFAGEQVSPVPKKLSELNSNIISFSSTLVSTNYSLFDTKVAAFETSNGESILLYYSPSCRGNKQELEYSNLKLHRFYPTYQKVCANFIYDLNGLKGPNTMGKDMGIITSIDPVDPILTAPIPTKNISKQSSGLFVSGSAPEFSAYCRKFDASLASIHETISMMYNYQFISIANGYHNLDNVGASIPLGGYIIRSSNSSGLVNLVKLPAVIYAICTQKH